MSKHMPEGSSGHVLPLHERVSRLVESLARSAFRSEPAGDPSGVSEEEVSSALQAWRERSFYLPGELVSDPAWVMLLELLRAEIGERQVTVSRLVRAAGVSIPGGIRWLKALEHHELIARRSGEAGEELVQLAEKGSLALRRYFREVVQER